ncbi:MAG: redoxin domain-containing protein [Myxococcota bacterium]
MAWGALLSLAPARAADAPARSEQSLPRFEGRTLDGGHAGSDLLQNRRGVIFVFSSKDPDADRAAALLEGIRKPAERANVALLGVSRDSDPVLAIHFLKRFGFDFPTLADPDGSLSGKLRLAPGTASLVLVDAQGYVLGVLAGLAAQAASDDEAVGIELRRILDLAPEDVAATPTLGVLPAAPPFEVASLDGKSSAKLGDYSGKVLVFLFFLPTCPHCHEMLKFLEALSKQLATPDLAIVPVSVSDKKYVVEEMVSDLKLSFPAYLDPAGKVQAAYGFQRTVPEVFVIDRKGRVVQRSAGASPRIEALLTLSIKRELGGPNPILLEKAGYSGEEFCAVCHRDQHATWLVTKHASAWGTLVEHGKDRDPECLRCHTVGFGQPGGFDPKLRQDHLRGVQCENCHGRGGPHQSPDFAKGGLEPVCLGCHTPQHSLRFVFAERLPLISHAANQAMLANLSVDERRKLVEKQAKRERQLFDKGEFAGSAACQSCHAKEHKLWSDSAHARAFATLEHKGEAKNAECQRCHTTGFREATGFPTGGATFAEVGCESCHGPGKRHVEDKGVTSGLILGLTDKCDSCAIALICANCHDDANDKGFEFSIDQKLLKIRHGFRQKTAAAK